MENLHLSYHEIFEVIPYRNLLLMSKDKIHIVTGKKVVRKSGKDFMRERMRMSQQDVKEGEKTTES